MSSNSELESVISIESPNFVPGTGKDSTLTRIVTETDCVLVLGQALNKDGTAPTTLVNRAKAAALLYEYAVAARESGRRPKNLPEFKVLTTGGDPVNTGTSESRRMKEFLMRDHGVPLSAVIMESQSRNTLENAYFSWDIVKKEGIAFPRGITLLTSEFHMPRSLYCFESVFAEKARLDAVPVCNSEENGQSPPAGVIPIVPIPVRAGSPKSGISTALFGAAANQNINEQSLLQRLTGERGFLENETVDSLHQHILEGSVVIPVPPTARMDEAKKQVDKLLELCKDGTI